MKLNYHAFPRRSGNFLFHAEDDEEAKAIVLEHLRERGDDYKANIFRWSEEKKDWDFEDKTSLEVSLEEPKLPQETEYKLTTTYVKYVNVKGTMTEDEFSKAAHDAANKLLTLPNIPGWEVMRERAEPTFCSDDDRYRYKGEVVEIKL